MDSTDGKGRSPEGEPSDDEPFGFLPTDPDPALGEYDLATGEYIDPLIGPALDPSGDARSAPSAPVAPAPAPRGHIPHRYRRSGGASMLAAGMIGLRDIIESPKDDRPVVEQHTNDDDIERPIEVFLDPDDPAASIVVIRDPADNN